MLIFIENTPRTYAWGSRDALPHMLGTPSTGEPQAELWLGAHPGSPASVSKATPSPRTLIDLIESDPARYGVNGGMLPFLLKVLAIGAPLSLQVHPNSAQAEAGFAAEEAAGVPREAAWRNYGDPHHKPELLVALSDVTALCGFRPLEEARRDLVQFADAVPVSAARDALLALAERLRGDDDATVRREFLTWALTGSDAGEVSAAIAAVAVVARDLSDDVDDVEALRLSSVRMLAAAHPGDPGILVSLLLHLVHLAPGEAIFLGAGQLHAYLGGIGVEIMASSDNVLRAGLTEKHVDAAEVCRIVDPTTLEEPRFAATRIAPGLVAWQPDVPDFGLMHACLHEPDDELFHAPDSAPSITVETPYPLVMIVTAGRVRVERPDADLAEVALVRRGQSLYVSAGAPIVLTGQGEVFLATVGATWGEV